MLTTADRAARAIWKLEQAGHIVTTQPGHASTITTDAGSTIAQSASLAALRVLADQLRPSH